MAANWLPMQLVSNGSEYIRDYCLHNGQRYEDADVSERTVALYGGLYKSTRKILPQEPREPQDAWLERVCKSVLAPYTVRLIDNAASLILRHPITIEGDAYWQVFAEDVDGWGSSLNEYARRLLRSALTFGHTGMLVDFPPALDVPNLAVERAVTGRRPYFVTYGAPDILGWRQAAPYPTAPLSMLRLFEMTTAASGAYGEEVWQQVRVIRPDSYEVYRRQNSGGDPVLVPGLSGRNTLGVIPFVPLYTNRTGVLQSTPPLIDIAEMNITHYQRHADMLHALHIAAMPTLVLEGWSDTESSTALGVNYAISMEPGNKAYFVGADASSFQAQQAEITHLEQQMSALGVTKLLAQRFVAESADAKRVDQAQANSVLAIVSLELETALNQAFSLAARYLNISPPTVRIDRDFDFYRLLGQDVGVLSTALEKGQISPEMFVTVMKEGEIYPDTTDVQKEVAYIEKEREASIERKQAFAPMASMDQQLADMEEEDAEEDTDENS